MLIRKDPGFKQAVKTIAKDNKYLQSRLQSSKIRYAIAFYVREMKKIDIKTVEKIISEDAPQARESTEDIV